MPWQVDKVVTDYGFPMGPFQLNDLAGIDVRHAIRQEQMKLYGDRRQSVVLESIYQTGRYGQKTNGGWYTYEGGSRKGTPEPEIEAMILKTSEEMGVERREFSDV